MCGQSMDDNAQIRKRRVTRDPSPRGSGEMPMVTTSGSRKDKVRTNNLGVFGHVGRKKKVRNMRRSSDLTSRIVKKLRRAGSPLIIGLAVVIVGAVLACILISSMIGHFSSYAAVCNESHIKGIPENIYNWCYVNKENHKDNHNKNDNMITRYISGRGKALARTVKRVVAKDISKTPKTAEQMIRTINAHERLTQDVVNEEQDELCYADLAKLGDLMNEPGAHHQPAIGPCHYDYDNTRKPSAGSYEEYIDFFFFRDSEGSRYTDRLKCYNECVDRVLVNPKAEPKHGGHFKNEKVFTEETRYRSMSELSEIGSDEKVPADEIMLIEAARAGMTFVVEKLLIEYGLDPLYRQVDNTPSSSRSLNAIQEAIRGGYAEIVGILSSGNNALVIDEYGRTIEDYVQMHGSPIRPVDAKNVLGIHVEEGSHKLPKEKQQKKKHSGWSETAADPYDKTRCDFDVVDGDLSPEVFYRDYFIPGRPVALRGQVSQNELDMFAKSRWKESEKFHPDNTFRVGPTAYPSLTDQESCRAQLSINDLEQGVLCEEMPGKPMVHAFHPQQDDFEDLYPNFEGEVMDKRGGFRSIQQYFQAVEERDDLIWQVFFGGDGSGATFHWHEAAFNILYVGTKEWKIAPPMYRGHTGMTAQKVAASLDEKISVTCIQQPGDLFFIPNFWGHSTINHGFTIGAAAIIEDWFQNGAATLRGEEYHEEDHKEDHEEDEVEQHNEYDDEDESPPFLFVHINKTGGTSLIRMFTDRCDEEYWGGEWYDDHDNYHRAFHATAHAYIEKYGRNAWENAYTFSVVRHPLARQVSNFFFLVGMGCDGPHNKCGERMIPNVDLDSMTDEEKIEAFHDWIQALYEKFPPGQPEHYRFGAAGHGNEIYSTFGASQMSWLVDAQGEMVVKDIYKLEELSGDMSKLADNIPCLKNGPIDMAKENKTSKYPHYLLFAKDEKTKKIINEVFADDFKHLGYDAL